MADLGGITGLLSAVVQRSVEVQQNAINNDAEENRTTTQTAGTTESAGAGTTSASATVGEGLAFQPIESTRTDQSANSDVNGSSGRVIQDQVSISAEARTAFEQAQAGRSGSRTPAEALQEEATNPAQNLAFRSDAATDAATIDGPDQVAAAAERGQTNQAETNEGDTGVVVGNTDVTAFSAQTRELGQLVDQFA
ncbi:hypothetical protein EOI86_00705 [Hwanghaeella grinnelliae]|uniref:Uncharacterized protein n=1 Tax=Hwanghaeella grinnelliae TaxID=2500179 RepID=A0A437QTP1_9PROT|nr:hypothetical protein [Hwanghaeella grinnelliae]RVU37856.1 hypothetical protein EOI86_00705 [Hwanghaeella grinnelliae]